MSRDDMSNNNNNSEGKDKRFWSLRPVLADLGAGFLVYLIIVLILLASRLVPTGFLYVAF